MTTTHPIATIEPLPDPRYVFRTQHFGVWHNWAVVDAHHHDRVVLSGSIDTRKDGHEALMETALALAERRFRPTSAFDLARIGSGMRGGSTHRR